MKLGVIPAGLTLLALGASGMAAPSGADLYSRHCAVCHQVGGAGVEGQFPRLAGSVPGLASTPAGRQLLVLTVLHGMAGRLPTPSGQVIGVMPSLRASMTDAEIAEVLNFTATLGGRGGKPFTPAEIATLRAQPNRSPGEMNALARATK